MVNIRAIQVVSIFAHMGGDTMSHVAAARKFFAANPEQRYVVTDGTADRVAWRKIGDFLIAGDIYASSLGKPGGWSPRRHNPRHVFVPTPKKALQLPLAWVERMSDTDWIAQKPRVMVRSSRRITFEMLYSDKE